jgi:hypothetical protein
MLNSRFVTMLLLAGALGGCATTYGRNSLGWGDGYREQRLAGDLWLVRAQANGFSSDSFALDMATYRAAELARDAGFAYLQLLSSDSDDNSEALGDLGAMGGVRAEVKARGVHGRDAPIVCEMPAPQACRTLEVAETLRTLGPRLHIRAQAPARRP